MNLQSCTGLLLICIVGLCGCQSSDTPRFQRAKAALEESTEKQKAEWVAEQGLREASPDEISQAKATETRLSDGHAKSPTGRFSVAFHMGRRITHNGKNTTTSSYVLTDLHSGKTLATIPSSISSTLPESHNYYQAVWFSPDEGEAMINEDWCEGAGTHAMTAVLSVNLQQSHWALRYLALPEYRGHIGVPERGSYPLGFLHDSILFNPLLSGKIFKSRLSDIPEAAPPVPFTVG